MRPTVLLLPLIVAACPGGTPDHPALGLTGDATAGAAVYGATCESCHGADGTGGVGSDLTATVPGMSREAVILTLVDGVPGTSMVSYDAILTDQEIADAAAYLLSEWGS
jgi:mono/diheme cytochrome c family protein